MARPAGLRPLPHLAASDLHDARRDAGAADRRRGRHRLRQALVAIASPQPPGGAGPDFHLEVRHRALHSSDGPRGCRAARACASRGRRGPPGAQERAFRAREANPCLPGRTLESALQRPPGGDGARAGRGEPGEAHAAPPPAAPSCRPSSPMSRRKAARSSAEAACHHFRSCRSGSGRCLRPRPSRRPRARSSARRGPPRAGRDGAGDRVEALLRGPADAARLGPFGTRQLTQWADIPPSSAASATRFGRPSASTSPVVACAARATRPSISSDPSSRLISPLAYLA